MTTCASADDGSLPCRPAESTRNALPTAPRTQRDGEHSPGDPLRPHPSRRDDARRRGGEVGEVVEDDVVRPVPGRAGRPLPDPGGEQRDQADRQEQRAAGPPRRGSRPITLIHVRDNGSATC